MKPIGSFPGELSAARHTVGHKHGCSLPSDNLTEQQIRKLNGEVKTVRLRPGIKWAELCALSDTMQREYLNTMISHGAHSAQLGEMFGVSSVAVGMRCKALGIPLNAKGAGKKVLEDDALRWRTWVSKCAEEDKQKEEEKKVDRKTLEDAGALYPKNNITITTAVTSPIVGVTSGTISVIGTVEEVLGAVSRALVGCMGLQERIEVFVRYGRDYK